MYTVLIGTGSTGEPDFAVGDLDSGVPQRAMDIQCAVLIQTVTGEDPVTLPNHQFPRRFVLPESIERERNQDQRAGQYQPVSWQRPLLRKGVA